MQPPPRQAASGAHRAHRSRPPWHSCGGRARKKYSDQNARRMRPEGMLSHLLRNAFPIRASGPRDAGSWASKAALRARASTGAVPSVPIATVTGSRSTIAGVMKSLSREIVGDADANTVPPGQRGRAGVRRSVPIRAVEKRCACQVCALDGARLVSEPAEACTTEFRYPDRYRIRRAARRSSTAGAAWRQQPGPRRRRRPARRKVGGIWESAAPLRPLPIALVLK